MTARADVQTLNPGAIWEGYVVDASLLGGSVYYLTSALNPLGASVVWQGNTYQPIPIEGDGWEASTNGALPHPTLTVANLDGFISGIVDSFQDLVGAVVTRKRCLIKYLDAANGIPGATPDPTGGFDDEVWVVEQKKAETLESIVFDLVAASDAQGLMLPSRQILTTCTAVYKNTDGSGLCPYTGALATCSHEIPAEGGGCRAHFPTGPLPFGGFPGAIQVMES
ncbi:phage minor tail protein L [Mesoterricola sediminis]|uniref:Phage minor tail protein L n=1 Tax=Mesoterricola sediminis TaxID=2927980 RepID=A0AA48GYD3_9BACT|nr:phage minor tail protein L [Mesoterricola sediminis]BDU76307.1 phage minor tail protein L [Mesoterricola sediminis]